VNRGARRPVRPRRGVSEGMTTSLTVLGDRNPDWITHRALDAALTQLPAGVEARWHPTDVPLQALGDGLWIAPGSPYRDDEAVLDAIGRARAAGIPLLGTCGGFQYISLALSGRDLQDHAESTPDAPDPLVAPLPCRLDGEWRPVTPVAGTRTAELLGDAPFPGLFFCGYAPREDAMPAVTFTAHAVDVGPCALEGPADAPFLMATLFHPQIGALHSEPLSPVIAAFAQAAISSAQSSAGERKTVAPAASAPAAG
jgi:CTP synthase (UTP-ammonia lyase)